jgi:drug efflux transport system permease protein
MTALLQIYGLIVKELLAVVKDPRSRFVLIGPAVLQLIVFGYAATFDLNHVRYALYNEDPSAPARELAARFAGSPAFDEVARLTHTKEVATVLEGRDAAMVLHIGRTFSRDLLRGRPATLQVILDGRNSNTALLALGYVRTVVADFNQQWAAAHGGRAPPAVLALRARYNPNLESRWFIVPGIVALLTLVVTLLVTALSVAREREMGTFDQLLVTPMRPFEILVGKTVPGLIIGASEGSFIIAMALLWFHIPLRGSLLALGAGLFLYLIAVVGIGLMISALAATQQQALLGTFLFLVPAVTLSGFATPIVNMPVLVQGITYLNPMRYFLILVRGVFLEGSSAALLVPQYWPMAVMGVVTLAAAAALFRRRLY